jgi:hypothetical protein
VASEGATLASAFADKLADWVRQQAVEVGCRIESVELEDWYRSTAAGNLWHGTCRSSSGPMMPFVIDVEPVWTPSKE